MIFDSNITHGYGLNSDAGQGHGPLPSRPPRAPLGHASAASRCGVKRVKPPWGFYQEAGPVEHWKIGPKIAIYLGRVDQDLDRRNFFQHFFDDKHLDFSKIGRL